MACKPIMFCLALVIFVAHLSHVEASKRVYPLKNVKLDTYFTCESLPKNKLSCPGDIKVIKGTGASVSMSMDLLNGSLQGLNQTCIEAIKKSTCLGIPRCERERQYVEIDVAIAACEEGRKVCPELIANIMLNCTQKKIGYEKASIKLQKFSCMNIQDSTGTCPDIKFKRVLFYIVECVVMDKLEFTDISEQDLDKEFPNIPNLDFQKQFLYVKIELQNIKPKVSSECYKKVQSTYCLMAGPICSADEKSVVSYLSKEKCNTALQCLSEKIHANGTKDSSSNEMCKALPDESKGINEPDPNSASFQAASFIVTFIILVSGVMFM